MSKRYKHSNDSIVWGYYILVDDNDKIFREYFDSRPKCALNRMSLEIIQRYVDSGAWIEVGGTTNSQPKLHGEAIKLDDKVWDTYFGWGQVVYIAVNQVTVRFEYSVCSYNCNGTLQDGDTLLRLFWDDTAVIPKKPPKPFYVYKIVHKDKTSNSDSCKISEYYYKNMKEFDISNTSAKAIGVLSYTRLLSTEVRAVLDSDYRFTKLL